MLRISVLHRPLVAMMLLLAALPLAMPVGAAPRRLRPDLVVGASVATISPWSMDHARQAGLTHVRHSIAWADVDRARNRWPWDRTDENDLDNVLRAVGKAKLKLVLRLDGGPKSAGGRANAANLGEVEAFYRAVAAHGGPTLDAIEVLTEPNLPLEWGGDADPEGYVRFLQAASRGIRAVRSDVWVIAGNLAPAPSGPGTLDDLEFVRAIYRTGARGSFDALGIHNYGGNSEPERDPADCGICYRRAELYRQILVENGDAATPIWSTETGWLLDTEIDLGDFNWMKVSSEHQADYLVRGLRFASDRWPWMFGVLVFNLDHSAAPWHGPETAMHWFSLLEPNYAPRPAYDAVRALLR
jgi:hypothetical protein